MDDLDEKVFRRPTDNIADAKDEIYVMLARWIDERVLALHHKSADRYQVMEIEVDVAMLYRLTKYFSNSMTKKTDAMLWKHDVLSFFDAESKGQGDENHSDTKEWRFEIESNFDRLINALNL